MESDRYRSRFWDRDGKEIDLLKWGELSGDWSYRLVKEDKVTQPDGRICRVTTAWLGDNFDDEMLDIHCAEKPGYVPRIFGTLIHEGVEGVNSNEFKHETLKLAQERHDAIVHAISTGDITFLTRLTEECGV